MKALKARTRAHEILARQARMAKYLRELSTYAHVPVDVITPADPGKVQAALTDLRNALKRRCVTL